MPGMHVALSSFNGKHHKTATTATKNSGFLRKEEKKDGGRGQKAVCAQVVSSSVDRGVVYEDRSRPTLYWCKLLHFT